MYCVDDSIICRLVCFREEGFHPLLNLNNIYWNTILPYLLRQKETLLLSLLRLLQARNYKRDDTKLVDCGKVSIILPTYNRIELLATRAIPTVQAQSYANWELLVISHGSTDGTNEFIENLSRQDSRIKLVLQDRSRLGYPPSAENHWLVGPVKPINAGLRAVTGKWIARIDDDDEWHPNHLEKLLELLFCSHAEFASSSYEAIVGGLRTEIEPTGTPPIGGVQTWVYRSYLKFFRANINSWRKTWNRVNDTDLQQRFVAAGVKIAHLREVTVTIRPRPGEKSIGSSAYLKNEERYRKKYG